MIILLTISLIVVLYPSCETRKSPPANTAEILLSFKTKAASFLPHQPDSAIHYADSGMAFCCNLSLPGDSGIRFLLIKTAAYKGKGMFDSAMANIDRIRAIATKSSDSSILARTSLDIGELRLNGENLQLAEKNLIDAINLYERIVKQPLPDNQLPLVTYQLGRAYNLYGLLLRYKGDYKQSQELLLKAYAIYQKLDKPMAISGTCINIGSNYSAIGSFSEAIAYYRKAVLTAKKSNDTINLIGVYRNIGVFYRVSNPDSSLYYYGLVQLLNKSGNNGQPDIITTYNMANIYSDKKDYNTALLLYTDVLNFCTAAHNPRGLMNAMSGMAVVYAALGKMAEAIACNKRAIFLADSIGELPLSVELMTELQNIYKDNNQFREAFLISEKARHLNDSILSLNKQVAIHELDVKYQTEKKNQENEWLKSELTIQEKLSKYRFNFILVLLLATLLLIFLLWRGYKLHRSREIAYKVLMSKYIHESELRNQNLGTNPVAVLIPDHAESPQDDSTLINDQLLSFYQTDKPYHNPGLKIEDVSVKLNIPKRFISAALKKHHNTNFNAFTNRFRVEEARQLMESEAHKNYTIEAIARDAGFGNRQSFYNTFELYTGIKPGYYRNYVGSSIHSSDEYTG